MGLTLAVRHVDLARFLISHHRGIHMNSLFIKRLALVGVALLLTACTTNSTFGVSGSSWSHMTAAEQKSAKAAYLHAQKLRQSPPIFGVAAIEWDKMSKSERQLAMQHYYAKQHHAAVTRSRAQDLDRQVELARIQNQPRTVFVSTDNSDNRDAKTIHANKIRVTISGGTANFSSVVGHANFKPVSFNLHNNQTKTVKLVKAGDNFFNSEIELTTRFRKGVLSIDTKPQKFAVTPQNYKATQFTMNNEWRRGVTFHKTSSSGFVGLNEVTVFIRMN